MRYIWRKLKMYAKIWLRYLNARDNSANVNTGETIVSKLIFEKLCKGGDETNGLKTRSQMVSSTYNNKHSVSLKAGNFSPD
jgi:hypothetical protein